MGDNLAGRVGRQADRHSNIRMQIIARMVLMMPKKSGSRELPTRNRLESRKT
jgi:hypothetical protein